LLIGHINRRHRRRKKTPGPAVLSPDVIAVRSRFINVRTASVGRFTSAR